MKKEKRRVYRAEDMTGRNAALASMLPVLERLHDETGMLGVFCLVDPDTGEVRTVASLPDREGVILVLSEALARAQSGHGFSAAIAPEAPAGAREKKPC